jgi:uncharacterized membrane protein YheB (UPF0754 family)
VLAARGATASSNERSVNPDVVQFLVSILFGALAGGTTNAVAVWMLFHPYEPPRLWGRSLGVLQGAIPKNKARLASAMGRTVGNKLLTADDLARTVEEPGFKSAFDEGLASFIRSFFNDRRGSLSSMLPPDVTAELRSLLEEAAATLLERADVYLLGEEARATARRWAEAFAAELRDQPLGDLLTPEREAALATAAEKWIAEAVEGPGFGRAIRDYLDRGAERLLRPGRTFQELLPIGLVAALERAIAGYLPIALERLAGILDDPDARRRVELVLHELLDRFMRDLKFHQRLVAALIITPETVDRVLRAIEAEGAAKISELLHDSAVRDAMARGVNNAIVDFLSKPVVSVLGEPGEPSVEEAKETLAGWALAGARDAQTRGFLVEKLRATLTAAERRTWGDIFRHLPPDRVADAILGAARSDRARSLYRDAAARVIDFLLERELGRIADHVPADAPERVERTIAPPLWRWLKDQVPAIAQRIDIAGKVEKKILEFPTPQLEAIIRGVTERELRMIVRLGYLLGAMIGFISAAVGIVFR